MPAVRNHLQCIFKTAFRARMLKYQRCTDDCNRKDINFLRSQIDTAKFQSRQARKPMAGYFQLGRIDVYAANAPRDRRVHLL